MNPTVILLGASVRAAADSAARAGWAAWCADLFADRDLRLRADVRAIASDHYPQAFLDVLEFAPAVPVIYTGALENHPALIAKLARPVWGSSPGVLRDVRNPSLWTAAVVDAGLPCPRISREPQASGRWLLKPIRGGAGAGVISYKQQAFDSRSHYLQEFIEGASASALCIGTENGAILVGVSFQLSGQSWLHAGGFQYAGNIGPIPISLSQCASWQALADVLVKAFRLRGLFGIDAIVRDDRPWPVEINPRYSASVEIHERATGIALLDWHRRAFDGSVLPTWRSPEPLACHGKAVMYARQAFVFPQDGPWMESLRSDADIDRTAFADIPEAGTQIGVGQPVLTFFASASNSRECLSRLEEIADALARSLWG